MQPVPARRGQGPFHLESQAPLQARQPGGEVGWLCPCPVLPWGGSHEPVQVGSDPVRGLLDTGRGSTDTREPCWGPLPGGAPHLDSPPRHTHRLTPGTSPAVYVWTRSPRKHATVQPLLPQACSPPAVPTASAGEGCLVSGELPQLCSWQSTPVPLQVSPLSAAS